MTEQQDDIVIGLQYGDESKGKTVDFLASLNRPKYVVRFSGGPQTAHNVIYQESPTSEKKHHTFAQLGSASFRRVPTILTRFVLINPFNLMQEGLSIMEKTDWNPFNELLISENALMITPIHRWLNQEREIARGRGAHGSCGEGIGETRLFDILHPDLSLKMGDLLMSNTSNIAPKLQALLDYAEQEVGKIADDIDVRKLSEDYGNLASQRFMNIVDDDFILERLTDGYMIFEGSQGVLLDESVGFHPHTTWSDVTPANAQKLIAEAGKMRGKVIGVTRIYGTRHGYGPFPAEDAQCTESIFPEEHNTHGRFQGAWRRGWLDAPLLDYAIRAIGGIDEFSVSHADLFYPNLPFATSYEGLEHIPSDFYNRDRDKQQQVTDFLMSNPDPVFGSFSSMDDLFEQFEARFNSPVKYVSYGPQSQDCEVL